MKTLKVICVNNIKTNEFNLYKSIESFFENTTNIKCYTRNGEEQATIEWMRTEIAENGVASIHTIKPSIELCGIELPAEVSNFVVSYMEVK